MGDERVPAAEADEQEFTGEELQVAPHDDADLGHGAELDDDGQYEAESDDDDDAEGLAAQLPPEPPLVDLPPMGRHPVMQPRDPAEVLRDLHFDHMTDRDQAEALRAAGGKPEHSLDRARRDILQERELAGRAVAYREYPEEWQGTSIKGRVRAWKAPFTVAEIEDWLSTYRGGGKYKIQLYMGNGRYLDSKVLDVEGDPLLPGAKEDEEARAREEHGGTQQLHDDRAAALERQLAEERFERRMTEERARMDAQMSSISHALGSLAEAIKHKPQEPVKPPLDLASLATSVGPLVIAYLQSQDAKAEAAAKIAREDRKALIEQQNAAEKRMLTLMQSMQGKKETLGDAIKALGEVKKLTGGENSEAKAFNKILDTALPKLIDATTKIQLHKAGVADGKDDEEFGAKMIVDRVTDLATAFIATKGDHQPAPPRPQQPVPALTTHGGYGPPVQQAAPPQMPMRGGGALVTPEEQAAHEAAVAQLQHAHAQALQHPQQGMPGHPEAHPQTSAAPPAPQQQQPVQSDVNFVVFDRALQFMAEGKLGSELAEQLVSEEEANQQQAPGSPHLYLSPRVIQYLCIAPPESVMNMLNPQIAQHQQYQALLDNIGQQFMLDFCLYFSQPEEPDDDDDDAGDDITGAEGGEA